MDVDTLVLSLLCHSPVWICTCDTALRLLLQAALFLYFSSEVTLVSVYSSRCCPFARTDTLFHSVSGRAILSASAGHPLDKNGHELKLSRANCLLPLHSDNNPSACKTLGVFNRKRCMTVSYLSRAEENKKVVQDQRENISTASGLKGIPWHKGKEMMQWEQWNDTGILIEDPLH